ncbi:MAG: HD domain-containing protein, partial [Planctomycetota bacterium]
SEAPMTRNQKALEALEHKFLAPYGARSRDAERKNKESDSDYRTNFQRDWNRVLHSRSFRKLEYKTQVMPFGMGSDFVRNRMTHTLEAMQIGLGVARALGVNEDLATAIVLAHDLGHPPFGHKGEETLAKLCASFNHNLHSLRIVEELEERYPGWKGLNLTLEVLEGIEKHETDYDRTFAYRYFPGESPTLEAQAAGYADTTAYRAHDVEDALVSGLVQEKQFARVEFWRHVSKGQPTQPRKVRYAQIARRAIGFMVTDLIETTAKRLEKFRVRTLRDVRRVKENIVQWSPRVQAMQDELARFLEEEFYESPPVRRACGKGQMIVEGLFTAYARDPKVLPRDVQEAREDAARRGAEPMRVVADHIAGMTDRFAIDEYRNLYDVGGRDIFG